MLWTVQGRQESGRLNHSGRFGVSRATELGCKSITQFLPNNEFCDGVMIVLGFEAENNLTLLLIEQSTKAQQ